MTADTPSPPGEARAVLARVLTRTDVINLNVGKAKPSRCHECSGTGTCGCQAPGCCGCSGCGYFLWKACPNCGDIGWDGLGNGMYACRISCGFRWTEDHPGWQIQRLPGEED